MDPTGIGIIVGAWVAAIFTKDGSMAIGVTIGVTMMWTAPLLMQAMGLS